MILDQPIESLPSTSPVTMKKFKSLEISTLWDLVNYVPFRYENLSIVSSIRNIQEGEMLTVKGHVLTSKTDYTRRRGMTLQKVTIDDGTGTLDLLWFNQPYITRMLPENALVSVAGPIKMNHKLMMEPISYERITEINSPTVHTGRLVPVYTEKLGLSSRTIREKIHLIFHHMLGMHEQRNDLEKEWEWLPEHILHKHNLSDELNAYYHIHFPETKQDHTRAHERLAFDELFTIQLSNELVRREWKKEQVGNKFAMNKTVQNKIDAFIHGLPFELTGAQKKVIDDVLKDVRKDQPMNRFVQGDVGSGKTVVAAVAAYAAYLHKFQTIIMAPTEILATQHYQTIAKLFANTDVSVGLQTGAKKAAKGKNDTIEYDIIVGTHALISKHANYEKIGMVVIDEQHRFGVAQRALLKSKGINPHLLTMTATPIPRTIALTLHGELDLSVIDEMPKGRLPIKTYLTPPHKRQSAYEWIRDGIKKLGIQVFIICPLIEESEIETMKSIRAATQEYDRLKNHVFRDFKVGMLHGKMKPKDKELIMQEFKNKEYDILVATSVVEVGIDVPNATIIVIEGSQRYGMAQLHQLRGRVGRGDKQSYCILFTDEGDNANIHRLKFFASTNNGMTLAEYDLKQRGPGDIYGISQHVYDDLKFADLSNYELISKTKDAVNEMIGVYDPQKYPHMKERLEKFRLDQISRD